MAIEIKTLNKLWFKTVKNHHYKLLKPGFKEKYFNSHFINHLNCMGQNISII